MALAISPDGKRFVVGGLDKKISVFDFRSRHLLFELQGHSAPVRSLAFAGNSTTLLSASEDGSVRQWPLGLEGGDALVRQLGCRVLCVAATDAFSAAGSEDGTLTVWRLSGTEPIAINHSISQAVCSVAFVPNTSLIVAGYANGSIMLWNPNTGAQSIRRSCHGQGVKAIAFSAGGKLMATGSFDNTAAVWIMSPSTK
jgi:WD40 repeat protein